MHAETVIDNRLRIGSHPAETGHMVYSLAAAVEVIEDLVGTTSSYMFRHSR